MVIIKTDLETANLHLPPATHQEYATTSRQHRLIALGKFGPVAGPIGRFASKPEPSLGYMYTSCTDRIRYFSRLLGQSSYYLLTVYHVKT